MGKPIKDDWKPMPGGKSIKHKSPLSYTITEEEVGDPYFGVADEESDPTIIEQITQNLITNKSKVICPTSQTLYHVPSEMKKKINLKTKKDQYYYLLLNKKEITHNPELLTEVYPIGEVHTFEGKKWRVVAHEPNIETLQMKIVFMEILFDDDMKNNKFEYQVGPLPWKESGLGIKYNSIKLGHQHVPHKEETAPPARTSQTERDKVFARLGK